VLKQHFAREIVHVQLTHPRFEGLLDLQHGIPHCGVQLFLFLRELAVLRECDGDVRGVAVLLATHVEQAQVVFTDQFVVGLCGVALVQDGIAGARAADAVVPAAFAAVLEAELSEFSLCKLLHVVDLLLGFAHHFQVGFRWHVVYVLHYFDFYGLFD